MESYRKLKRVVTFLGAAVLALGFLWPGPVFARRPTTAKQIPLECQRTQEPMDLDEFFDIGLECPPGSPVFESVLALDILGMKFPNVLEGFKKASLRFHISHFEPERCDVYRIWPHRVGFSPHPRHGESAGLYCGKQKLLWADPDSPHTIVSEAFHAADELALRQSGIRKGSKNLKKHKERFKELAEQYSDRTPDGEYGENPLDFYGAFLTTLDPAFWDIWEAYLADNESWVEYVYKYGVGGCGKKLRPSNPHILGCQGLVHPAELFMEIGDWYFEYLFRRHVHGDDSPMPETPYPELLDYFLSLMSNLDY